MNTVSQHKHDDTVLGHWWLGWMPQSFKRWYRYKYCKLTCWPDGHVTYRGK